MAKHHTTKKQRRALADRMKDTDDELKLVIVRDMWLTGFDAPSMHTLYICLLYTSPSPRDATLSRMPSSA